MIGVAEGGGDNRPRVVPSELLLVDEDALKLGDRDRGVRVVELDGDRLGEVFPRGAGDAEMAADEETKKYCWMRRSSLPFSVLSFG